MFIRNLPMRYYQSGFTYKVPELVLTRVSKDFSSGQMCSVEVLAVNARTFQTYWIV